MKKSDDLFSIEIDEKFSIDEKFLYDLITYHN